MTVLAPLLLAALAALAVPVLLHLRRHRQAPAVFPALRYLEDTLERTSRRLRLRDRVLLLLRLAILALLVLGAARLVLPLPGGTHPPAALAIVVDDGIRGGTVVEDRLLLDHLRGELDLLLDELGPADRIWIVHGPGDGEVRGPMDPDGARAHLATLEPGPGPPSLPLLLERGQSLLETRTEAGRHLVLAAADPVPPGAAVRPDLHLGRGIPLPPNTGIQGVESARGLLDPLDEIELLVTLAGDDPAGRSVRFVPAPAGAGGLLDPGLRVQAESDPAGRALLRLPPPGGEGWVLGTVEIDPDALRADDRVPVALQVGGSVPIRLHLDGGEPSSPWLAEAAGVLMDAGRGMEAPGPDPAPGEVWVLNGLRGVEVLEDERGIPDGTTVVVVPPAEAIHLPRLHAALRDLGSDWGIRAGDGGGSGPLAPDNGELSGALGAALSEVEAAGVRTLDPGGEDPAPPGDVLVRATDGRPWLVRTGVAGSTLHLLASDGTGGEAPLARSAAGILLLDAILGDAAGTPAPASGTETFASAVATTTPGAAPEAAPQGGALPGDLLGDRRGREVSGWLLLLALALLLVEGWLGRRSPGRPARRPGPHPPTTTPS